MGERQPLALDANIIIVSFELNVWEPLSERFDVVVTRTIINIEACFFKRDNRIIPILESEFDVCTVIDPDAKELSEITSYLDDIVLKNMDPGEREILALAKASRLPDGCRICSSDGPAIHGLALLGLADWSVSFESLLKEIGYTKNLDYQFTEAFRKVKVAQGQQDKIQGVGVRKP